jgi:hypothetical protein
MRGSEEARSRIVVVEAAVAHIDRRGRQARR